MTRQQSGQSYRAHQHPEYGMMYMPIHREQLALASLPGGSIDRGSEHTEEEQESPH